MFTRITDFSQHWKHHTDATKKVFSALTQESLSEQVADEHRNLGRMAWHVVTTIPEMAEAIGMKLVGPGAGDPVPKSIEDIRKGYDAAARSLQEQVEKNWNDRTLEIEDDLYGQKWKKGMTLLVLIQHEVHHRGQMTVLMRQAGLKVPGVMGPSKEEWVNIGMKAPEI